MEGHHSERLAERRGHAAGTLPAITAQSASFDQRTRSEDSWVEISSQPSSSSLSSVGEDADGRLRQQDPRTRRRRTLRPNQRLSNLTTAHRSPSAGETSSQEEYDESESESDRVMTSSGEGPMFQANLAPASQGAAQSDEDDEDRTAINHPLNNDQCFTPQPNAFSHPPTGQLRTMSQPSPGSYFPAQRRESQSSVRTSLPPRRETNRTNHMPQNILSPSYDAAAHHDEALRSSLSTLLSLGAAARGIQKPDSKRPATTQQPRNNRVDPSSFRLVPESALPQNSPTALQEPTFKPTLRRDSTSTSTSSEQKKDTKRKAATTRSASRERRALKKARRTASNEDLTVSPTLLTWVVSAGVVVVLSALSFSAGYSMGKEAGRMEGAGALIGDEQVRSCAREAGRSSMGLKRSLARSAVQA